MDHNLKHYNNDFFKDQHVWDKDYQQVSRWIGNNIRGGVFGDIGCGNGRVMAYLYKNYNKKVWGIDGSKFFKKYIDKSILKFVKRVDLTQPHNLKRSDVAICLEVAEHIDFKYSDILVDNIVSTQADTILFTAAPPGQDGTNHINLQPPEFWIKKFIYKGYFLNNRLSDKFRKDLNGKIQYTWWYLNNFMVFQKVNWYRNIINNLRKLFLSI